MKETGLLFKPEMVRAILANIKTETRRIVKSQRHPFGFLLGPKGVAEEFNGGTEAIRSPYSKPGDRLWVRETWRVAAWTDDVAMAVDYAASPELVRTPWKYPTLDVFSKLIKQSLTQCEKALAEGREGLVLRDNSRFAWPHGKSPCSWRPSIFMPRWASRITLEITGIRVERLQDITEAGAIAEGCSPDERAEGTLYRGPTHPVKGTPKVYPCARAAYRALWESINGPGSWELNPWVWVIQFRRIET